MQKKLWNYIRESADMYVTYEQGFKLGDSSFVLGDSLFELEDSLFELGDSSDVF